MRPIRTISGSDYGQKGEMRSMTLAEREQYRREVHQKMLERAQEKGIAVPAEPKGLARRRPAS